jgi:hypothetical protein
MSAKTYSTKEAVELLKQGKKIASEFWLDDTYIILSCKGRVTTNLGHEYSPSIHMFEGYYPNAKWVEHKDIKKYTCAEALELMKNGRKVKRSDWATKGSYFYMEAITIKNSKGITVFSDEERFLNNYSGLGDNWIEYGVNDLPKDASKPIIEEPQPCCRCHFPDPWNSKGADGKWYCYKHCSF